MGVGCLNYHVGLGGKAADGNLVIIRGDPNGGADPLDWRLSVTLRQNRRNHLPRHDFRRRIATVPDRLDTDLRLLDSSKKRKNRHATPKYRSTDPITATLSRTEPPSESTDTSSDDKPPTEPTNHTTQARTSFRAGCQLRTGTVQASDHVPGACHRPVLMSYA
jgi:hypothetical protein